MSISSRDTYRGGRVVCRRSTVADLSQPSMPTRDHSTILNNLAFRPHTLLDQHSRTRLVQTSPALSGLVNHSISPPPHLPRICPKRQPLTTVAMANQAAHCEINDLIQSVFRGGIFKDIRVIHRTLNFVRPWPCPVLTI